jgi:hypothetical protein
MATSEKTEKTDKKWKSCGYISKTKNPKVLLVMVRHQRFIVNLNGFQAVLNDKIEYTPVYEFIGEKND